MSPRESVSWVPKHTSSESIEHPIVTSGIPCKTYIKCYQIHKSIQSDNSKTSNVKLNSSQEGRGGETPYDSTIVAKLAVHQDCAKSRTRERERERERERDQTHSYWYIPSAPRVNYSLLVTESAGMMKMATDEGSPLQQGAGTGSREVFGGYRGLRQRNSRSILIFNGFRVRRLI